MTYPRHNCIQLDPGGISGLIRSRRRHECSCVENRRDLHAMPHGRQDAVESERGLVDRAILLVEPDDEIRGLIRFGLEKEGYRVVEAASGRRGVEIALQLKPRAILLDLDVSDSDGLSVLRRMRERSCVPILALSDRLDEAAAISALDYGANDYIQRPFSISVLSARLRASLRAVPAPEQDIFCSGSLRVDFDNRTVQVAGRAVNLSATEYSLLHLFVRHAGRVLTHLQILREIWGSENPDKVNDLRVYLRFLRKKLENPPEPNLFHTEKAVGYRLVIRQDRHHGFEATPRNEEP